MVPQRHIVTLLRIAFVTALIAVFVLALLPAPDTGRFVSWQDKIEHALLFFALMLLGAAAWRERTDLIAAGLLAYGVAMEFAQSLTTYRFGDAGDWLADAVGVLGAVLLLAARRARKGASSISRAARRLNRD